MKKLILLTHLLFISIAFAQNSGPKVGVINGIITDQITKEKLPYVNIIVKDNANNVLTGGITNDQGVFNVNKIPAGENIIEIQYIGYKTVSRKITFTRQNATHNLGTIALAEDTAQLDEVVVVAETSTVVQKIDRKVINVGKDLTSAGTTASELLNNVQSVSVDSQTGNISLRGNENVRVLVDGKPSNISVADLLKQIPSTSIKQVELITNPSAKYNPEGMSGIINIVLHKNANQGFNGSIDTGLTQGENTRFNGSLNMNYKTGKVNFFGNYGYNTGKNDNFGHVNRTGATPSLQEFTFDSDRDSHLIKAGADVYLNDKNTLSFYTTQNFSDNTAIGLTKVTIANTLVTNAPNEAKTKSNSGTYNLNYKLELDDKNEHNLEFEATYSNSDSPEKARYNELIDPLDLITNYSNNVENETDNFLFNLDYTLPLFEKGKLEIGGEIRTNKTTNLNISNQYENTYDSSGNVTGNQPIGNSSFGYDREMFSGYTNYGHEFGKLTMQLGVRLEQYNVDGTFQKGTASAKYTDKIFSAYPSAFFTYNPSEKNQYQVSYSRRVDRPGIGQVNPIREWSTPLITSVGNPDLKPQFTNSYEVNYTRKIKNGSITFGSFYRKINNNISRYSTIDPLDGTKQLLSYTNYDNADRYGFEVSSNYKIAKWWRANASLDYYSKTEKELTREVKANSFNARLSNSFTATKKLRFQLFSMYRGPEDGIQFNRSAMWMINVGSSLSVLKNKGTISFRVNDIFKGMKFEFESTQPYVQNGQFNWESRTAYLGFNYRFGGGKNKALQRKQRDNNEKQGGGGMM
jgi:outer membrane receptor protein involved in Fe transport